MAAASMRQLLEAGVYFDRQTKGWNPKMVECIFTERNGIYIIDLQRTMKKSEEAYNFVRTLSEEDRPVLFIGARKQAQDSIREEAECTDACYVNACRLGGVLTSLRTICHRINHLDQLKAVEEGGTLELLPRKEVVKFHLGIERLEKFLGDIKDIRQVPGASFTIDPHKEYIAVTEVKKLGIPIVAVVGTNCDPDKIDYIIPDSGDVIRAAKLVSAAMVSAVAEGREGRMGATAAEEKKETRAK